MLYAMDWTARFREGGRKVYAFHTLDLETRALHQTISGDKSLASVDVQGECSGDYGYCDAHGYH